MSPTKALTSLDTRALGSTFGYWWVIACVGCCWPRRPLEVEDDLHECLRSEVKSFRFIFSLLQRKIQDGRGRILKVSSTWPLLLGSKSRLSMGSVRNSMYRRQWTSAQWFKTQKYARALYYWKYLNRFSANIFRTLVEITKIDFYFYHFRVWKIFQFVIVQDHCEQACWNKL